MTPPEPTRYQRIADTLRGRIASGVLGPGDRLPSERALAEEFDVSRPTLREALKELRAEGLLDARQGDGVYVRTRPQVIRLSRNRLSRDERQRTGGTFAADMAALGLTPRVETAVELDDADGALALALNVDEGTSLLARRRRMWGSDTPMQLATSYFPADPVRGTAVERKDTGRGGVYARLEELGHVLVTPFVERVSTRAPSRAEREWFGLADGVGLLVLTRIARTAERPVEVNRILMRGDRYELEYEIAAD